MGWLWNSSSPSGDKPSQQSPSSQSPENQPTPPPPTKKGTGDPALDEFLNEFSADLSKSASSKPQQPPPEPSSTTATSTLSSWLGTVKAAAKAKAAANEDQGPLQQSTSNHATPASDALAHSLRPTSMSCRQAFDQAYECQSMGGQLRSVYRYGGIRSCSHLWDDFWFCMRVKSSSGPVKDEMVREHYRKKELDKYAGKPNSEDVWRSREEKVAPGSVFNVPYVEENVSDEEWRVMEMERRRQIRKELGYE